MGMRGWVLLPRLGVFSGILLILFPVGPSPAEEHDGPAERNNHPDTSHMPGNERPYQEPIPKTAITHRQAPKQNAYLGRGVGAGAIFDWGPRGQISALCQFLQFLPRAGVDSGVWFFFR